MSRFLLARLLPGLLLLMLPAAEGALAEEVTIYRCVDRTGALALRDTPCAQGETQQVRSMQRPKDPAPGTAPAITTLTPAQVPATRQEVQVVYRTPPRPMYECVTADGDTYTSDNGEGNPRLVPLWTQGYPGWSQRSVGGGRPGRPGGRPPPGGVVIGGGSTWVRDECHPLPQQEVCDRLSDRRYELIRGYNSALQSERRQLELEQRGVEARLSNDCGNQ